MPTLFMSPRSLASLLLLACASAAAPAPAQAQPNPQPPVQVPRQPRVELTMPDDEATEKPDPRYPLRVHLLAVDDTHHTVRLQPNWCSGSLPTGTVDAGGGSTSSNDPCGSNGGATSLGGGDDDFSGAGRADLVTLPAGSAQGLSFTYEGCSRVRIPPGFEGLPARWKRPGKLEVLIPSDAIAAQDSPRRELPIRHCTLTTRLQPFVYLRMPNGSILTVTQEAYLKKPSLRLFLSGGPETLHARAAATVSVKQLQQPSK